MAEKWLLQSNIKFDANVQEVAHGLITFTHYLNHSPSDNRGVYEEFASSVLEVIVKKLRSPRFHGFIFAIIFLQYFLSAGTFFLI